jgi:hypothetical protein
MQLLYRPLRRLTALPHRLHEAKTQVLEKWQPPLWQSSLNSISLSPPELRVAIIKNPGAGFSRREKNTLDPAFPAPG